MNRRAFVTGLGAVLAAPLAAEAQPANKVWRIGMLETSSRALNAGNLRAFQQKLGELGYVEGQNYSIEYRSADGEPARFPELAVELVRSQVDVILARGSTAARAAKKASATIPIIVSSSDPLTAGLVSSLAHPGGNITGVSSINTELVGKRLEILKEMMAHISRVAMLVNSDNPTVAAQRRQAEAAGHSLRFQPQFLEVRKPEDLDGAFNNAARQRADAIHVGLDFLTQGNVRRIVGLAAKYRLPAIYSTREFVDAGGLMAYGVSRPEMYRRVAMYVDKIFKGATPADLPIEQPTKFELVINLKTAKALGLTIPPSLLLRADQVIE